MTMYDMCVTIQYLLAFNFVSLILYIRLSWALCFWAMSNFIYILPHPQMPLTNGTLEFKSTWIWSSNTVTYMTSLLFPLRAFFAIVKLPRRLCSFLFIYLFIFLLKNTERDREETLFWKLLNISRNVDCWFEELELISWGNVE
jgi:type IV secretory pathway TraG/TraD family ATPase VirD4